MPKANQENEPASPKKHSKEKVMAEALDLEEALAKVACAQPQLIFEDEKGKAANLTMIIAATAIISAIVMGGIVYAWQQMTINKAITSAIAEQKLNLADETKKIQDKLDQAKAQLADALISNSDNQNEAAAQNKKVNLYYYNKTRDTKSGPNPACSANSVITIIREMPESEDTSMMIEDAVSLLLEGKLTEEEKNAGFTTEFPGKNFTLISAKLENGVATLNFADPDNFSSGGSCRVSLLRAEIEKTVRQFPGVNDVKFVPESLFQP